MGAASPPQQGAATGAASQQGAGSGATSQHGASAGAASQHGAGCTSQHGSGAGSQQVGSGAQHFFAACFALMFEISWHFAA